MQVDPTVTVENILRITRKEDEVARPEDTRCKAQVGKGRCKEEITYNTYLDHWSKFCTKHDKEDQKAREKGTQRVQRAD